MANVTDEQKDITLEVLKKEIQRTDEEIFVSISFLKGEDKDE